MDRVKAWFEACVRAAVARLPYAGVYRYSVVSCDFAAQTLDLAALDEGQPNHTRVPIRAPGLRLDIAPGSEVGLGYFALDPRRPYVATFPQDPTAILRVEIIGATARNAREGDSVSVTIQPGSLTLAVSGANATGPAAPLNLSGTITSGSSEVFS